MGSGNDAEAPGTMRKLHFGNHPPLDLLVSRGIHLVGLGEIHPQLDHLEIPAPFCKLASVKLLMQDA
jgi:hypothetical protein